MRYRNFLSFTAAFLFIKILIFYRLTMFGGPMGIAMPNFVKIDHSVVEISRFFKMAAGAILDF